MLESVCGRSYIPGIFMLPFYLPELPKVNFLTRLTQGPFGTSLAFPFPVLSPKQWSDKVFQSKPVSLRLFTLSCAIFVSRKSVVPKCTCHFLQKKLLNSVYVGPENGFHEDFCVMEICLRCCTTQEARQKRSNLQGVNLPGKIQKQTLFIKSYK